jgi:hypothetical protein
VRVSFPVPRGIRKSDVTLALADNSLRLTLRDFPQPLLDVLLLSLPPPQQIKSSPITPSSGTLSLFFFHASLCSCFLIIRTVYSFWKDWCLD